MAWLRVHSPEPGVCHLTGSVGWQRASMALSWQKWESSTLGRRNSITKVLRSVPGTERLQCTLPEGIKSHGKLLSRKILKWSPLMRGVWWPRREKHWGVHQKEEHRPSVSSRGDLRSTNPVLSNCPQSMPPHKYSNIGGHRELSAQSSPLSPTRSQRNPGRESIAGNHEVAQV